VGQDVPPTPLRAFFMLSVILVWLEGFVVLVLVLVLVLSVDRYERMAVLSGSRSKGLCYELVCTLGSGTRGN
jgi:hypothetical protein